MQLSTKLRELLRVFEFSVKRSFGLLLAEAINSRKDQNCKEIWKLRFLMARKGLEQESNDFFLHLTF